MTTLKLGPLIEHSRGKIETFLSLSPGNFNYLIFVGEKYSSSINIRRIKSSLGKIFVTKPKVSQFLPIKFSSVRYVSVSIFV